MTQEEIINKVLTAKISIYTALCVLKEVLDEEGYNSHGPQKKKPSKVMQNLLSAHFKLDEAIDKLMPDYNENQNDFVNQVSKRIEELVKNSYHFVYKGEEDDTDRINQESQSSS